MKLNITWDAEPLGIESDRAIASRLRVSKAAVWYARTRRGIAPIRPQRPKCTPAKFAAELDGSAHDREIAQRHALSTQQVAFARRRLGAAAKRFNWDHELRLGLVPDHTLAVEHGVWDKVVAQARARRNIPKWSEERTCPCGSPFVAFQLTQRFCCRNCQRYHWKLVACDGIEPGAADLVIAMWSYKRTMARRVQNVVKQPGFTRNYP